MQAEVTRQSLIQNRVCSRLRFEKFCFRSLMQAEACDHDLSEFHSEWCVLLLTLGTVLLEVAHASGSLRSIPRQSLV